MTLRQAAVSFQDTAAGEFPPVSLDHSGLRFRGSSSHSNNEGLHTQSLSNGAEQFYGEEQSSLRRQSQQHQANSKTDRLRQERRYSTGGSSSSWARKRNGSQQLYQQQPYGSGDYTNQLELRTPSLKKAVTAFGSSEMSQKYTNRIQSGRRGASSNQTAAASSSTGGQEWSNNSQNFNAHMESQRAQEKLREKLYFDERTKTVPKSTIKNQIIEKILTDGEVFVANKELMQSIYQLKKLHLLKQNQSHVNRFNGVGKFPFVFNDYHTKSTNNGYSRQEKGGYFFTK